MSEIKNDNADNKIEEVVVGQREVEQPVSPTEEFKKTRKLLKNKKILLPILGIIGIIIIVVASLILLVNLNASRASDKEIVKAILNPDKPILIEKDSKYNYITTKGKKILPVDYKYATEFNGGYAIVGNEVEPNNYTYQIIDESGTDILKEKTSTKPIYIKEFNVWVINNKLYNSSLEVTNEELNVSYLNQGYFTYTNELETEVGIINHKGKKIWSYNTSSINAELSSNEYSNTDLYVAITLYDRSELIVSLESGKEVYKLEDPEQYNIIQKENNIFTIINAETNKKEKHLYFRNKNIKYETDDANIKEIKLFNYTEGILELNYIYNSDNNVKYYDIYEEKILDKKPNVENYETDLEEITYGFRIFESAKKYGLMSKDKVIIKNKYDQIKLLPTNSYNYMSTIEKKDIVILKEKENIILLNMRTEKEITKFIADKVDVYDESTFIKLSIYDENALLKKYIFYNLVTGKSKEFDSAINIQVGANYLVEEQEENKVYYNTNLEPIYKR